MTATARAETRAAPPEPGTRAFVWGVWGLLTLAMTAYVACFGANVPVLDDYNIVDALVGARRVTPGWLWEQTNEHRLAVPKLVLLVADRLAGNDVRAGMFLSVAALSVLSAGLIRLASRLPGGLHPCDAVLPLLVQSFGPGTTLLWSIHFANVLPTAIATGLIIPIARMPAWPGLRTALGVGVCLVVLPLCGGTGLVFVPALALWLFAAGLAEARAGRFRRAAVVILAALPGVVLTGLYFRGFRRGIYPEPEWPLYTAARAALQFLTCGLGMPAARGWPWSGMATALLVALAVGLLVVAWVRQPAERPRIVGLFACLIGLSALAAAVGWGRGWAGAMAGFQERYVTMATPLWCWLVVTIRLYAPPALGTVVRNALFAVACALAWPNTEAALAEGRLRSDEARALARDIRSGLPAFKIIKKYTPYLHFSHDEASRMLPLLRRAGLGPFRHLRENPSFAEVPVALAPAAISMARWDGTTVHVTGVDPQVTFALSRPRRVAGIRIRYSHANRQGAPARFQLSWTRPGQLRSSDSERYANWFLPSGQGKETTVWVDDVIDQFRIQPDNQPGEFRIGEIVLLVP